MTLPTLLACWLRTLAAWNLRSGRRRQFMLFWKDETALSSREIQGRVCHTREAIPKRPINPRSIVRTAGIGPEGVHDCT